MPRKLTLTALSATFALLAMTAYAGSTPEGETSPTPTHAESKGPMGEKGPMGDHKAMRPNFLFKTMDKDGDGKVTKAEHDVFVAERFKETDTNNDGAITEDEMKAYGEKKRSERMKKMMEERKTMQSTTAPKDDKTKDEKSQ